MSEEQSESISGQENTGTQQREGLSEALSTVKIENSGSSTMVPPGGHDANLIGVGIIGCGRIGQVHAKTLKGIHDAELIMMADPIVDFGQKVAEEYHTEFVADWKDLVADPRIQAVVIGSPTPYHAEQIIASARAGKDIFCEKPISNDLAIIDDCLKVVEETGVRLLTGFQRRFDPNFKKIHDHVAAGVIGNVRMFHIISRDPAPPPADYLKKSGGIFLDMASHDFDMARFITQSEIEEVHVTGAAFGPEAAQACDFDSVITTLKMANGSFGTIENSRRCAFGYDQRIEVFGADGVLNGRNRAPEDVTLSTASGVGSGLPYSFFMDRYEDAYRGIMKEFVMTIKEQRDPVVTGADGRAPILAGMACKLSAAEGRSVKLSEVDIV